MKRQQPNFHKEGKSQTAKYDCYPVQLAEEYEFFGTKLKNEFDVNSQDSSVPPRPSAAPLLKKGAVEAGNNAKAM